MSSHLAKKGFMSNHLLWRQYGEVWPPIANESDGNDVENWMDDIIAYICRGYGLGSADPLSEVQNFYRLHVALEEKVNDGIDVVVL
jgi:hypothetical protein